MLVGSEGPSGFPSGHPAGPGTKTRSTGKLMPLVQVWPMHVMIWKASDTLPSFLVVSSASWKAVCLGTTPNYVYSSGLTKLRIAKIVIYFYLMMV